MITPPKSRGLVRSIFDLIAGMVVLTLVILAVWLATTLAAYLGGPQWLAILVGLFLCPVLPLAWDAFSNVRRRKRKPKTPPKLGFVDRMLLRTSFINTAFMAGLLLFMPATAFTALSARGDWMLEGQSGDIAEALRRGTFFAADRLEWLHRRAPNPFAPVEEATTAAPDAGGVAETIDAGAEPTSSDAGVHPGTDAEPAAMDAGVEPSADASSADLGAIIEEKNGTVSIRIDGTTTSTKVVPSSSTKLWPSPDGVHAALARIPADSSKSWKAIASYLAKELPNERERARAIHDWVADNLAYDKLGLSEGRYGPQDPESVFASRKAVCSGYTQLFNAMLKEAGIEARAVEGGVRGALSQLTGREHVWSAVRIDERWHLVDVTWDSPHEISAKDELVTPPQDPLEPADQGREGLGEQPKLVSSNYFLTPPEIFGLDHFPEQKKWQLRDTPLSRGEFIRQPMLSTRFFRAGFVLEEPKRSQVDARGEIVIRLANPSGHFVLAKAYSFADHSIVKRDCDSDISGKSEIIVRCALPTNGTYQVLLFSSPVRFTTYELVAQLSVTNRI